MKMRYSVRGLLMLICFVVPAAAQERFGPLQYNALLNGSAISTAHPAKKTTALKLPFFEDFTDYTLYPNNTRWTDSLVYINNTMGISVISRGVATFDALNKRGRPYDTADRFNTVYA